MVRSVAGDVWFMYTWLYLGVRVYVLRADVVEKYAYMFLREYGLHICI